MKAAAETLETTLGNVTIEIPTNRKSTNVGVFVEKDDQWSLEIYDEIGSGYLGNVTIKIPTNRNLRYVVNGGDGDNDGHNTDP